MLIIGADSTAAAMWSVALRASRRERVLFIARKLRGPDARGQRPAVVRSPTKRRRRARGPPAFVCGAVSPAPLARQSYRATHTPLEVGVVLLFTVHNEVCLIAV